MRQALQAQISQRVQHPRWLSLSKPQACRSPGTNPGNRLRQAQAAWFRWLSLSKPRWLSLSKPGARENTQVCP